MKKIDAQKKYKELFDKNVELQTDLDEAVENGDDLEIEGIAYAYASQLDRALDTISRLILTGVQDGTD